MSTTTTERPKRRVGRPAGRKKTQEVPTYLSPAEEAAAKVLAKKRNTTVSGLLRTLLVTELTREQKREEFDRAMEALTPEDIEEYMQSLKDEAPEMF